MQGRARESSHSLTQKKSEQQTQPAPELSSYLPCALGTDRPQKHRESMLTHGREGLNIFIAFNMRIYTRIKERSQALVYNPRRCAIPLEHVHSLSLCLYLSSPGLFGATAAAAPVPLPASFVGHVDLTTSAAVMIRTLTRARRLGLVSSLSQALPRLCEM